MIKETIEKLKGIIAQSDTGHLPLSCRIELMKQVGDVLYSPCRKSCANAARKPVLSRGDRLWTMYICFPA